MKVKIRKTNMIKNEIDNINGTSTQEKKESKDDEDKNIANDDN